jgi:predicted RNase H-like nuclease (RuvC/YqgF family)
MRFHLPPSLAAGLLLAGFAAGAGAQTPAPAGPAASAPRVVSRDELRTCMNTESTLLERRKALEARAATNQAEVVAIRAEAAKMAEDQKAVDAEDERKVRAFKRVIDAHNARVQAANTARETFRTDLDSLNKGLVSYNETCGSIAFKKEDKDAILKEREAAAKK